MCWTSFDYWTTTLVCVTGGLLGILYMIPMRKVFIVESDELKFPEGVACAEILFAGQAQGDKGQKNMMLLFKALGVGAALKFLQKFLSVLSGTVEGGMLIFKRVFAFGFDVSPALVGVGYIVGLPISFQVFAGGCIGWLLAIPLLEAPDSTASAIDQAYAIWSDEVRYIGVGEQLEDLRPFIAKDFVEALLSVDD